MIDPAYLWDFLPRGYALTVAIETPILLVAMSAQHSFARRAWLGLWLTAFTYPMVVLVLPLTVWNWYGETAYLVVAETYAPVAECWLFSMAYAPAMGAPPAARWRDWGAIVAANLASFLTGEVWRWWM